MLPHMQLAPILQSYIFIFFSPLSVFPTHVLLPEPILIMHDFFFFFVMVLPSRRPFQLLSQRRLL